MKWNEVEKMYKNYYDTIQMSESSRRCNNIRPCQIVGINEDNLTYRLPWGKTSEIRLIDFEIGEYQVGEWIDMIFGTISSGNTITLQTARFIGRTPEKFIPKD